MVWSLWDLMQILHEASLDLFTYVQIRVLGREFDAFLSHFSGNPTSASEETVSKGNTLCFYQEEKFLENLHNKVFHLCPNVCRSWYSFF